MSDHARIFGVYLKFDRRVGVGFVRIQARVGEGRENLPPFEAGGNVGSCAEDFQQSASKS